MWYRQSPGSDGFTFGFFKTLWHLVDGDVVKRRGQVGFGDKWRKWIQCCLHSSKGSIIINGSPTDEFQFGRGLKQGDPLSPFLFLLIMESLHISFQRVVDAYVPWDRSWCLFNLSPCSMRMIAVFICDLVEKENTFSFPFLVVFISPGLRFGSCIKALHGANGKIDEISGLRYGSWTLNNSGGYTVASSRNMIDSRLLPKGDLKTRWIRYVPNKWNHLRLGR
ncbi:RNA-directed DNA polymerase, eukaryota [Tanacetum coccineum]